MLAFKQLDLNIGDSSISLRVPADEEASLADAAAGKCVDPYWAKLWDTATDTAHCIVQKKWPANLNALELGCGSGLVGVAGLMAGLDVTFSDHEPQAVELALQNGELNGFAGCKGIVLDWADTTEEQFDMLLASDVLYEKKSHLVLLKLAEKILRPNGQFLIGDPGRQLARDFLSLANDRNWKVQIFSRDMKPCLTPFTNEFQLLVLER